ncbi:MAG TPA: redoxin domain-containing protein [Pyrinomonadaceae bacterium]|nr:redoxin domain-containing protein [Pyrinomonadaceae bacterium]
MMMKKLALALFLLALSDAGALAHVISAHRFSHDGFNRRNVSAAQRKARSVKRRAPATKARRDGVSDTPLVAVTEIDGEGLKKLLQRGEAEAARPLLVNFWATWCVPCRKEFPDLVKIEADYRASGLEFALVSADDVTELKTAVPKFLREMRATAMPAYLLNAEDTEAAIAQVDPAWGGQLPATFLFDRQGKIAYRHFGIINPAELRLEIDKVTSDK